MTFGQTIHILRHAHSSWAVPGQRDHQRVLDDRGRKDAARLAASLGETASRIERVVCSTAVRARQTLDLVRKALPPSAEVRFSDDLYALGAKAYEAEIRSHSGSGDLLLVGHNPTIEDLVFQLCETESAALREARAGVGTANWLVIDREADGAEGTTRGVLRTILRP
ncbi:histidine phosphatase family protein [Aureimonas sp. SK2]|uniref:SixA phosphatase family protein n=1 Tax=Aureimonas sp. SK2 TaxID=3015992 RepID=UPI002444006F|nr:histidine phosphatase family protein [Aureimonas sp. SK2]